MPHIKDEKSVQKPPAEVDVIAMLRAEKNRWHLVVVFLIVIVTIQCFYINDANERAEVNTEVLYLKMYSNGSWDVQESKPENIQDFYRATVDKLLDDYVVARYGILPATIRRDYGFAINFMDTRLAEEFTSPNGFNAAQKAADVLSKIDHPITEVKIGVKDHYDKSRADFSNGTGEVIRTNIYFTEQQIAKNGQKDPEIKSYILSITWHLLSPTELKGKSRDYFSANPIGIEIIKEEKYLDPAQKKD